MEKNWTPREYRNVTSSIIYKTLLWCRALFMNRWILLHDAIILRILTDPEFNEICIFGSGVKAEMRHVSYGILSRVIFSHNENCDWILRQIWCVVCLYIELFQECDNNNDDVDDDDNEEMTRIWKLTVAAHQTRLF